MENMPEFNSDRREFFRINDTVYLEVSLIDNDQAEDLASTFHNTPSDENGQQKQQLTTLQTSITHLIDQINQSDREVARALRLLDEKINIIAHSLQRLHNNDDSSKAVEANLSGGGIAFLSAKKYESKSSLEMRIELRPSGTILHAIANVIACNKVYDAPQETPYHLRLVFTHMSEVDRNLLVRHTLSRQAEELRMKSTQA